MYHPFSVAETFKTAWDIYKKNFITIVVYSIISFLLISMMGLIVGLLIPSEDFYPRLLGSCVVVFIQAYTTLGLYKLIFTLIDSEYYEFEVKQVLPHISMILSYLAVVFIIGFCIATYRIFVLNKLDKNTLYYQIADYTGVAIGLYAAIRIMFFNTYIVDDKSGPIESLRQSIGLTRDYTSKVLLVLGIILIIITLLVLSWFITPALALILFFAFAYPFVNIMLIVTYRKLVYSHKDVDDDVAETL
jgi:ABC-type multidrug transport system fused ATPase/permease subunit